jgi:leucyl-tRNA synthetase
VQVLGKVRARVKLPNNCAKDVALAAARDAVASWLDGKNVVKEIVVPNKLVNFVAK